MQRSETVFCVGSSGSGKTILLKKLEQKEEQDWHELVSSTIPTVGINHFEIDKEWDLMPLSGNLNLTLRLSLKDSAETEKCGMCKFYQTPLPLLNR